MKDRTDTNRASLYAEVTARVIAELEAGRLPWVQPWSGAACGCSMPCNAGTGRRYSGINVLILWGAVITSRAMIETEQRLEHATIHLDARRHHGVGDRHRDAAVARAAARGMVLSTEQHNALEHVTSAKDLGVVIGYAGTGKSAMLGVAREAWAAEGYHVRGLALSGIAAENLENGSGIAARTIASIEHQWAQDRDLLTDRHVLVIDEAGMIGTRQMERVIAEAQKRGAKVVLVGDPEQLQAIEAGAAFRSIAERHGGVEIADIRRQGADWQRDATRHLATGRTAEAVRAYDEAGYVHASPSRERASADLIDRWDRDRQAHPDASRIILTHTNYAVHDLNLAARDRLRAAGDLGDDITIAAQRGRRDFATGDRIMFLKNERSLGVKNGSIGTVQNLTATRMAVMLDDGRSVAFDIKNYAHVDHGYATTIHKAQGVTVDRVQVLATPGLDRHAAYVALSRHRTSVDLHYGQDDFVDQGRLVRTLSRERIKDMASDHAPASTIQVTRAFGERRGIRVIEDTVTTDHRSPFAGLKLRVETRQPTPKRSIFDGLRLRVSDPVSAQADLANDLGAAVRRYAVAFAAVEEAERVGRAPMPYQRTALDKASERLDHTQTNGTTDLRTALRRNPGLVDEAKQGRTSTVVQAMTLERELRADPARRADRFVEDWRTLSRNRAAFERVDQFNAASGVTQQMSGLAKSLERDPQVESLLRNRTRELGLKHAEGASISQDLQQWLGLSRSRGIGR